MRDGLFGVLFRVKVQNAGFGGGVLAEAGVVLGGVEVGGGVEVSQVLLVLVGSGRGGGCGGRLREGSGWGRWGRRRVEKLGDLLSGFEFEDIDLVDGVGDSFEVGAGVAGGDGVGG